MNLHPFDGCELCIRTLEARREAMESQEPEPTDEDEADFEDYRNGHPPKA